MPILWEKSEGQRRNRKKKGGGGRGTTLGREATKEKSFGCNKGVVASKRQKGSITRAPGV